jgi:hydrogenase maturation protease
MDGGSATYASVTVLGLGNTLLADDGAGIHVIRHLAQDRTTPPWLKPLDGGTLGFRLTGIVAGADHLLIVDAADLGEPPGTIRLLSETDIAAHLRLKLRRSAHEAGLADLLTLAKLEGFAPRRLALLAIQPRTIDWGEAPSEPVAAALPTARALALQTARAWRQAA